MSYPPAPWILQGYALQTLQLIDVEKVRPFIPSEFEIISVLPGKTVGGITLSSYNSGSLSYSELIVVAGIVHYSNKIGGWVSHIYVDNLDSVAGGREIWGLPKELAEFTWEKDNNIASEYENYVVVRQKEQILCQLSYNFQKFGLQLPLGGDFFSTSAESILLFKGKLESCIGIVGSRLQVPDQSPFVSLGLARPWLTFYCDDLRLVAHPPTVVGQRKTVFSK